jgi:hypothetical protein
MRAIFWASVTARRPPDTDDEIVGLALCTYSSWLFILPITHGRRLGSEAGGAYMIVVDGDRMRAREIGSPFLDKRVKFPRGAAAVRRDHNVRA